MDTDSGDALLRMFCSNCGSNVITANERSDFVRGHVIVMSGCFDGAAEFEPKQEFYCKDKCGFIHSGMKTQKFENMVWGRRANRL